ncbi:hypothetical protein B296_00042606 [Ensete ventricosum]|uniref:Uncharacterized protein n=1 Tax=Ensete ventricosum TaxID=4639 RepID=A0A426ZHV0_ENSVE|nr:hypothetical protein B296_00042606 [Ensete ventricosum]
MDVTGTTFLFSSFLVLLLLLLGKQRHSRRGNARLPPGPFKLPLIGSLHHVLGRLPHRTLAALSEKFGAVMLLKLGEVPTLVVSSPEAAAEIMKTQDVSFASRPMISSIRIMGYGDKSPAFAPYGSYWREVRKMSILELLSVRRVQSFRSIREEEVLNFVRSMDASSNSGSTVNLSSKFLLLTNDIAARAILGRKCKYQKQFLQVTNQGLEESGGFSLADLFPSSSLVSLLSGMSLKLPRLHREMDAILSSIIQEHREGNSTEQAEEDLVDVLLKVQREGSLPFAFTDEAVKAVVLVTFLTLISQIRAMKRVQEEVRETVGGKGRVREEDINEMNYLRMIIKETMRLHPPLPLLLPRECQEPREILGYQIPEKTRVLVNVWALGRDPRHWDDAAEFKPERFDRGSSTVDFKGTNFEFIPFGAGRRMCPGIAFGMASVELPLACLLYHFDWELPARDGGKPGELDMAENFSLTCRRRSELSLRAIPRNPCPMY